MKAERQVDEKKTGIFQSEMALWVGIFTALVFFAVGKNWLMDLSNPLKYGFIFIWLFVVILWLSFGVVRHADCLAIILGEPYGTLILSLAVISIEVIMIAAVMLTGENNPTPCPGHHIFGADDCPQRYAGPNVIDGWPAPS